MWTVPGGAQETERPCARSCARAAGRSCLGTAPVNSVYVFDDRVVLNINFTDDAKTVTREEVLGSSAVDNVQHAGIELASRNHTVAVAEQKIDEDTVARCEFAAERSVVDATRTARGATILKDARGDIFRPARQLAHIERALCAQAKLAIDRGALAGTDLAAHNLGWLARRG